jgi:hypothetical protein
LQTVAYADVFDYPLTVHEVHRYLAGVPASVSAVRASLADGLLSGHHLVYRQGYVTLPGRESIVETRLCRQSVCQRLWPKGIRYGLAIASVPFVRLVAVTGTLAVDNVEQGADIDYLIATAPGRVWLARLFALVYVYLGRLEGVTICPNYVISVDDLEQFDHTLFTAHELAQMVPLYGLDVYQELVGANPWAQRLLPNAFAPRRNLGYRRLGPLSRALKRGGELVLGGKLGDMLEQREMRHKIPRLKAAAARRGACAAVFSPDCCKGHLDDHGERIGRAYARRLREAGVDQAQGGVRSASPGVPFPRPACDEDSTDAH